MEVKAILFGTYEDGDEGVVEKAVERLTRRRAQHEGRALVYSGSGFATSVLGLPTISSLSSFLALGFRLVLAILYPACLAR